MFKKREEKKYTRNNYDWQINLPIFQLMSNNASLEIINFTLHPYYLFKF